MSERTNRREEMIEAASDLFIKQGYTGTSIQQIADAVGCTKAALYYHFKEGKEELLQEVLYSHFPSIMQLTENIGDAASLYDFVTGFGYTMLEHFSGIVEKIRWVILEYPHFNEREQQLLHEKQLLIHRVLADRIQHFIKDREEAEKITWQMMCTFIGYALYFISLDLQREVDLKPEEIIERTAALIACGR